VERVALVGRGFAYGFGDVGRPCRARLVFQPFEVGLDLGVIKAHLKLRGKRDVQAGVLCERLLERAEEIQAQRRIRQDTCTLRIVQCELSLAGLAMIWRSCSCQHGSMHGKGWQTVQRHITQQELANLDEGAVFEETLWS
jgi:hypothetical protein